MIGRNGERRSGMSARAARHDDDDISKMSISSCGSKQSVFPRLEKVS